MAMKGNSTLSKFSPLDDLIQDSYWVGSSLTSGDTVSIFYSPSDHINTNIWLPNSLHYNLFDYFMRDEVEQESNKILNNT